MFHQYWERLVYRFYLRRGLRLLGRGSYDKAAVVFEKALLQIKEPEVLFYYAVTLIALNQHQKAITYLEQLLTETDAALVATTLADCYLVLREWEKAEELMRVLHDQYTENYTINYLYNIAIDPVEREKYAMAKDYFFKSKALFDKKEYDEALAHIAKAIELNDTNSSYCFLAGIILIQKRTDKAQVLPFLERAVQLSPQNESFKKQLHYVQTRYK